MEMLAQMSTHTAYVNTSCRVCGSSTTIRKYSVYHCQEYRSSLLQAFSIDPEQDTSGIHPPNFCKVCYATMINAEQASCLMCHGVLSQPIELQCSHHCCSNCIITQIQQCDEFPCPTCNMQLEIRDCSFQAPSPLVLTLLGNPLGPVLQLFAECKDGRLGCTHREQLCNINWRDICRSDPEPTSIHTNYSEGEASGI